MSTRVRYESRTGGIVGISPRTFKVRTTMIDPLPRFRTTCCSGYKYPDAAATSTEMTPHASHEETSNTGQQSSNSSHPQSTQRSCVNETIPTMRGTHGRTPSPSPADRTSRLNACAIPGVITTIAADDPATRR